MSETHRWTTKREGLVFQARDYKVRLSGIAGTDRAYLTVDPNDMYTEWEDVFDVDGNRPRILFNAPLGAEDDYP